MKPSDYTGKTGARQGAPFKPWDRIGRTQIAPLEFLHGRPWDDVALAYVHALRPSHIRVIGEWTQADAEAWRVTVTIADDGSTIRDIIQEVDVGLPDKAAHGEALDDALEYGLDSAQVEWHRDCVSVSYDLDGNVSKRTADGRIVRYPEDEENGPPTNP